MTKAILLLSGGLDSVVAGAMARQSHQIDLAMTFDYGQRAGRREIAAARRFCTVWEAPHEVVALPWLASITKSALVNRAESLPRYERALLHHRDRQIASATAVWVPNRNGTFLNIAAAYAEARGVDYLITGFNAEEAATFPDNSAAFVERANAYLALATLTQPKVVSPIQALTKREIIAEARRLDIPLEWCWPCYEGGPSWCGVCESCARLQRALQENT